MPPKPQTKKPRKPLTPLQRKRKPIDTFALWNCGIDMLECRIEQKRKYDLIHKAQVKSQYYKELNKDSKDDTPDYVKEVQMKLDSREKRLEYWHVN